MRRVVVTGLGMVSPLACGVEPTWKRLLYGESGAKQIETFEVADLPSRIACVIPRGDGTGGTFNPDQWMEPKDQRKVDDFIIFGMCAAKQALDDANWHPQTEEDKCATGHHHIGIAVFDDAPGLTDAVIRGRTRGSQREIGPFQAEHDRQLSGDEIDDRAWDKERGDLAGPTCDDRIVCFFDQRQTADARADTRADLLAIHTLEIEPGVPDRLDARGEPVMDEAIEAPRFFGREIVAHFETLHLARYARSQG